MTDQDFTPTIQLNVQYGPDPGKKYILKKRDIYIGRGLENDVVIAHAEVSRRHSRLSYQEGLYQLEDLGSTNGTYIEDEMLTQQYNIRPGEVFWIGSKVSLAFTVVEDDLEALEPEQPVVSPAEDRTILSPEMLDASEVEAATVYKPQQAPSDLDKILAEIEEEAQPPGLHPSQLPQKYVLTMQNGPNPGQVFALKNTRTSIGRHIDNDIVIADEEVSRYHATINLQEAGWVLEDLGSTNGTFVLEKQLVSPHTLLPGDTIWFGDQISLLFDIEGTNPWGGE